MKSSGAGNTPISDACDAAWTQWLQDTWVGVKDMKVDTAPMTPIECARKLEAENAALRKALIDIIGSIAPEGETGVSVIDCVGGNQGLRQGQAALKRAGG